MSDLNAPLRIPAHLAASRRRDEAVAAWLRGLPAIVTALADRWSLLVGPPIENNEVSAAWVAPVSRNGARAVLKIAWPHMEGEHEIDGLRFWGGDPTVRLLEADAAAGAMLLESCEPGTHLRAQPAPLQDVVIGGLLRALRRQGTAPQEFRPLSSMLDSWSDETLKNSHHWPDPGVVRAGLRLFAELSRPAPTDVLLATDLHAGNVLSAQRAPWLVIDPKPFIGDPCYDATQHLLNSRERLRSNSMATIRRFADVAELDAERVRLWTFARLAADPRTDWHDGSTEIARAMAL
jgi:streptomycin 6-kinase